MKKWTVMLIPHDRGSTRTLTLSNSHLWVAVGIVATLSFLTAFLLQRNFIIAEETQLLRELAAQLEQEKAEIAAAKPVKLETVPAEGSTDLELREIEARLRSEYEASIAAITADLNELLDMEAKARDLTGLKPRKGNNTGTVVAAKASGGKGGPDGGIVPALDAPEESVLPPNIIYGMARPSADLLKQEMQLRKVSLGDLLADISKRDEEMSRLPSLWPVADRKGRISSRFGYRRDPFNRRLRHHSGTDIAAPHGTRVMSTGAGVVKESTYDGDYGNIVKISHGNGLETWYAHLSERSVKKGQPVERGQFIGKVGSTGRSTGPHLHYEVHKNGKVVDAEVYLP